eukprot:3941651-Rhodomonas_salina.1
MVLQRTCALFDSTALKAVEASVSSMKVVFPRPCTLHPTPSACRAHGFNPSFVAGKAPLSPYMYQPTRIALRVSPDAYQPTRASGTEIRICSALTPRMLLRNMCSAGLGCAPRQPRGTDMVCSYQAVTWDGGAAAYWALVGPTCIPTPRLRAVRVDLVPGCTAPVLKDPEYATDGEGLAIRGTYAYCALRVGAYFGSTSSISSVHGTTRMCIAGLVVTCGMVLPVGGGPERQWVYAADSARELSICLCRWLYAMSGNDLAYASTVPCNIQY